MIKQKIKRYSLAILILLLFLVIGCSNNQEQPPNEISNPNEQIPINNEDNLVEEGTTNENEQQIEKVKYYVNKNNFLIKPVNPEEPSKVILLTFDDAPQGDNTYLILDTLDKYNAKAIFFVTGYYAKKNEELIKEIYDRGHFIGNHTWTHPNLNDINTYEETKEEINKLNDLIYEITGEYPQYFRSPYGAYSKNDYVNDILIENNMQSMNWSLGSRDWEIIKPEKSQELIDEVINNAYSGANILMHDKEITAISLDSILSDLQNQGYSFVLPTEVIIE